MKKIYNPITKKGLTLFQLIIIFCLNLLYYYGVISIAMVLLIIIVVVFTGNARPVINSSLIDALPIITGAVIFYPTHLLINYLLKYWRQQNK